MSNLYLIIYISLWALVLLFYQRKRKYFGAASVIIFSYLIYAIISFFLYNDFNFRDEYGELTIGPFLYLFLLLMIALYPTMKFKEEALTLERPNTTIVNLFSFFYIASALVVLPSTISNMSQGLAMLALDPMAGEQLYAEMHTTVREATGGISNIFSIIYNLFSPIGILVFFYYLTLPRKNIYLLSIYFVAIICSLLYAMSKGSRTEVIMVAYSIIMAFFIMKPFLSRKTLKYTIITGAVVTIVTAFFFLSITISRFGNNEAGTDGQMMNYLGQCNINFNLYALDAGGIRNGDRTCNTFKYMLGWDNIPRTIMETRYKYPNLRIDDGHFYTFVGDFVLDFGPIITFFLFVFFSIFVTNKLKTPNQIVQFHQLILAYFAMTVCMQGGMYLFYYSFGNNLIILAFAFSYFGFKYGQYLLRSK